MYRLTQASKAQASRDSRSRSKSKSKRGAAARELLRTRSKRGQSKRGGAGSEGAGARAREEEQEQERRSRSKSKRDEEQERSKIKRGGAAREEEQDEEQEQQRMSMLNGHNDLLPQFQVSTTSPPPTPRPRPTPPPPLSADHDFGTAATEQNPQSVSPVVASQQNLDWTQMVLAFCLASAVGIAILSVQINSNLPLTFHLFSLAITFAFSSLFIAKFIAAEYPDKARFLNQIGVFCTATAFYLAVTFSFPVSLKCVSWTLYAFSLLIVILCNRNYLTDFIFNR